MQLDIPAMEEPALTEEEQRMVEQFTSQIDLNNTNVILQYGAGTQKKMADFSEKALANVQTKDLGEIGELITGVVAELKGFDAEEEERCIYLSIATVLLCVCAYPSLMSYCVCVLITACAPYITQLQG